MEAKVHIHLDQVNLDQRNFCVAIGSVHFPVPPRDVDIRKLKEGDSIIFIGGRDGRAEIIRPGCQIGCHARDKLLR